MIRVSALQAAPIGFLSICLLGVNCACAQQQPQTTGTGTYASSAGLYSPGSGSASAASQPSETGLYPSATSGLAGQSMSALAGDANSANGSLEKAKITRESAASSAWNAAASSTKQTGTAAWLAGGDSFKANSGSWGAGQSAFGILRQAGGIWHGLPTGVSEASGTPSSDSLSTEAPIARQPVGLNVQASGTTQGLSGRKGSGPSLRGFGTLGKASNPLTVRGRSFGSFGSGGANNYARHPTRSGSSGTSLNDSLNPNGSIDNLGLGSDQGSGGSSH